MLAISRISTGTVALLLALCGVVPAAESPTAFVGELSLVRYDIPRGGSDGFAPTRQLAKRVDGPNAVDWPAFTLNGQPIFRDRAEEKSEFHPPAPADSKSYFQVPADSVIEPGNHWFRAMQWLPGRRHIYTADATARGAAAGGDVSGRYELWTFPIRIAGAGGPVVRNVVLKSGGSVVFQKPGPWRSLTLLLPANEPGKPYELTIDGREPVQFNAGLQPVKLGDPRELVFPVEAIIGAGGAQITVRNLARPDEFPNGREWDADVAALRDPLPRAPMPDRDAKLLSRYLGIEVPRSPLLIYAAALPLGMSGGFFKQGGRSFAGSLDEYAGYLADMGFDAVFEHTTSLPAPDEAGSFERRAVALVRRGISFGLQYDNNAGRPSFQNPNLAIFAHALPEWHGPLYRSLQLAAQRFAQWPNFIGIDIGAADAGYAALWPWAPPTPQQPWGEAMIEFMGTPQPKVPRAPGLGAPEFPFEQPVKTTAGFAKYLQRYDTAFRQYGYFAEAVHDVHPRLVFTTGSFGSAPGSGGRGGWPWASLPGRVMFEGLNVQQAYDWNQAHASKPLHNVALLDRLGSYAPDRKTWALLDNFQLLFGREAYQRACALALTRGIQGIGTNFLPGQGDAAQPEVAAFEKEMALWMRKYGGVYAATKPVATIGIFYSHHQALQRRVVTGADPKAADLYAGSHEGRVTEALFLCHAAGWPARVITYQEVARGPLPESMKAILLVGLDQADETWSWGPGLEPRLQEFLARGGRIIADSESVCAVPSTRTELKIAAYVAQSHVDPTPLLFTRNADNIVKLRASMEGVAAPLAAWDNPRLWVIPTECGTTQYVTAVNQSFAEGKEAGEWLRPPDPKATKPEVWKTKANASLYVKPQMGALKWNTTRPIYDVRLSRKLSADEAGTVDLTEDAFRWYALPAAEVVAPQVIFEVGASGFWEAKPTMMNGVELSGIPVEITVRGLEDSATVHGATGQTVRLPINEGNESGDFAVTVTELLTGLKTTASIHTAVPAGKPATPSAATLRDAAALAKFAKRKHVTLTIALTPEQAKDAALTAHAKALAAFYEKKGRRVTMGSVAPGGIVESLQPLKSPNRFPQWKTIATDLVLFGTPANNVLLLDQARAQIFPRDSAPPAAGRADVIYTRSPFVGEYDAVNVLASDAAGFAEAVKALTK